jgi:predicted DNA-binding transcriptional regulator AlpA
VNELKEPKSLEPRWARGAAVAKHLGITTMTLWRWVRDPRLDFPRPSIINDIARYDLNEVDAWMRSRSHHGFRRDAARERAKQRCTKKQDAVPAQT